MGELTDFMWASLFAGEFTVILSPLRLRHKERKNNIGVNLQKCAPAANHCVTKNRCVTHVKIRGYANLVSSLLAYLISAVASRFCNSILSRSRMLLQIACYCNVTLFSIAGKF